MNNRSLAEFNISKKITDINTLPADFQPKLDSKWTIIETLLDEQQKSKRHNRWLTRAAALLLVFISATVIYLYQQTPPQTPVVVKPAGAAAAPQLVEKTPVRPLLSKPQSKIERRGTLNGNLTIARDTLIFNQTAVVTASAELVADASQVELPEEIGTKKKTKKRFTQLDFGETITTNGKVAEQQPYYTQNFQLLLKPKTTGTATMTREPEKNNSFRIKL